MRSLIILLVVFTSLQRTIEPIRVTISAPSNEVNEALAKVVRVELRKLGDVVIAERRADYLIQFNASPIVGCDGYVAAVVVAERETRNANLEAYSGPTLEQIARYIVQTVNRENFDPWRERTVGKK